MLSILNCAVSYQNLQSEQVRGIVRSEVLIVVFLEMQVCWDLTQHHIPEDLNLHVRHIMIMYILCTHKQKVEIIRVTFNRDQPIYLYFSFNSNYTLLKKIKQEVTKT